MNSILVILVIVQLGLLLFILWKLIHPAQFEEVEEAKDQILDQQDRQEQRIIRQVQVLGNDQLKASQAADQRTVERLMALEKSFAQSRQELLQGLMDVRASNAQELAKLRKENQESLDKINGTVNEKLQKSLDEKISQSFAAVNQRLKEVYEGLGEMRQVASGVNDLKNVLANVKTRGILGEVQLEAILEDILAPEQFGRQVAVVPNKKNYVDFAVKMPGDGRDVVWLPIDSKFPGERYAALMDAYDAADAERIKSCRNVLRDELRREAKSIREKYVQPPYTTDFAVMFLPFEGLYAEAVNMGMVEELQREYRVNIAGPSTMAALLNSLQMGFRTLAIQKKSGEVWTVLEKAKKEFGNFEDVLSKTRDRLRQADEELERLVGTRTRAINRSLKEVGTLEDKRIE